MGASVYRPEPIDPGRRARDFVARLALGPPVLLDGATGTELERRGAPTRLPLWSARALVDHPDLVLQIHRDYAEAGAEVLTANTFRTQARTLAREGLDHRAAELTGLALALARRGSAWVPGRVWVAGSMPPLEDCYRPDLVPGDAALAREHAEHARHLAASGADILLVETMNSIREAVAAGSAARATGLPVWISFACDGAVRLLSGEPLAAALEAVAPLEPALVGVNCLPPAAADAALSVLAAARRPFSVYANLGAPNDETGFTRSADCAPAAFAACALRWWTAGARAVGGCCGTTPEHIRAVARRLASR
jgi:S-methylmethionine-dependent homocysteine/selenocysteine methylase